MKSLSSGLLALLLSGLCSCATATVWEVADPNAEIVIKFADISEETLKARGIHYYKSEKMGCYFVEKSASQKLRDYTIRCFAAPVTITLDTATIGVVAFAFLKSGTPANPNTSSSDTTWPEWINHLHY